VFDSYLVRQPIFDSNEQLVAYDLDYKFDQGNVETSSEDHKAIENIINGCIEYCLDLLAEHHLAFIKVTDGYVSLNEKLPPPSHQLILKVSEDIGSNTDIAMALKSQINKGYQLALDDFDLDKSHRNLIQLSTVVQIDIQKLNTGKLSNLVSSLQGFPVKILAKNIDTLIQYDQCRKLGLDYYKGRFIFSPRITRDNRLPANRLHVMQLLAELQKEHIETHDLENIIEQDVALSYKLLRYINSASVPVRNKVESIRHSIIILGQDEVKRWASMISLSNIKGKTFELIRSALLRAKMCELLTAASGQGNNGAAFIVGLFSTLDALMDTPLNELLSMLPLADDIKNALLYHKGPYTDALNYTLAYEKGDWKFLEDSKLNEADMSSFYFQAVEWSNAASRLMQ